MFEDKLGRIISKICEEELNWFNNESGHIVDPIDNRTIDAHYSDSHFAASLFLLSNSINDSYWDIGIHIVDTLCKEYNATRYLPGYHSDFNNFAFSIICSVLHKNHEINDAVSLIDAFLLSTTDSNNFTVNWLPMRMYVNYYKYLLTNDYKYLNKCKDLECYILKAINNDYTVEDRLPTGISYNIQYNISTVAVLLFLKEQGYVFDHFFDFESMLCCLINLIAPDGDINYMGRGCNQIFAWGPWLYILSRLENKTYIDKALSFLEERVISSLGKRNIVLNDFDGENKLFWWDYHYCSVYYSHLLLWLVLANKQPNSFFSIKVTDWNYRFFSKYESDLFTSMVFSGRKEYLPEKGPSINYIWSEKVGMLFKGCLGPWYGSFGNKYVVQPFTLNNFLGLIETPKNNVIIMNRIFSRLGITISRKVSCVSKPIFVFPKIWQEGNSLFIEFNSHYPRLGYLNIPVFTQTSNKIIMKVIADGTILNIRNIGKIPNPYGWCDLYASSSAFAKKWLLEVEING